MPGERVVDDVEWHGGIIADWIGGSEVREFGCSGVRRRAEKSAASNTSDKSKGAQTTPNQPEPLRTIPNLLIQVTSFRRCRPAPMSPVLSSPLGRAHA